MMMKKFIFLMMIILCSDLWAANIIPREGYKLEATRKVYTVIYHGLKDDVKTVLHAILDGADVNARDFNHQTLLNRAVTRNLLGVVSTLIEYGASVNDINTSSGLTALHFAANFEEGPEMAKLLMKAGADFNSRDFNNNTPLHWAAMCEAKYLARLLVESERADLNSKNNDNDTPLHLAAKWGEINLAKLLVQSGRAEINSRNRDNNTPLHLAAKWGDIEMVALLVQSGRAEINSRNRDNCTPLHLAVKVQADNIVRFLVKNGAIRPECMTKRESLYLNEIVKQMNDERTEN